MTAIMQMTIGERSGRSAARWAAACLLFFAAAGAPAFQATPSANGASDAVLGSPPDVSGFSYGSGGLITAQAMRDMVARLEGKKTITRSVAAGCYTSFLTYCWPNHIVYYKMQGGVFYKVSSIDPRVTGSPGVAPDPSLTVVSIDGLYGVPVLKFFSDGQYRCRLNADWISCPYGPVVDQFRIGAVRWDEWEGVF